MNKTDPITAKRIARFVEERARGFRYDADGGSKAAVRAGFPPVTAGLDAVVLLTDPEIGALIQARVEEIDNVVEFTEREVLREWVLLATADPAKVTKTRHLNCRHCWGAGHEYQWGAREYAKAVDAAMNYRNPKTGNPEPKMPPGCEGGFGWVFNAAPNRECPECRGEGVRDVWIADMDTLGPAERKLIAAVKQTKDGLEVKMRDQGDAVQMIAKYLGLLVEKRELTGKDGRPLIPSTPPVDLPDDPQALGTLYTQIVGS